MEKTFAKNTQIVDDKTHLNLLTYCWLVQTFDMDLQEKAKCAQFTFSSLKIY